MLNLKKGLAVALAAATVLTFAPVNASAFTVSNDASSFEQNRKYLPNSLNVTTPTVLLSLDHTSGSFTWDYDQGTELKQVERTGVNFTNETTSTSGSATGLSVSGSAASNLDTDYDFWYSASGRTVTVQVNPKFLRGLNTVEEKELTLNTKSNGTTTVKVYFLNGSAKMSNLKVTLHNANDGSKERYVKQDKDNYFEGEAVPTGIASNSKDITTGTHILHGFLNNGMENFTSNTYHTVWLNLQGYKQQKYTVTANTGVSYRSEDDSIATADATGITAKKVGTTAIHITTQESSTTYGSVEAVIYVTVIDKPAATLSAPSDITVYGYDNPVKIGATGTGIKANSIQYDFVFWNPYIQEYMSADEVNNWTSRHTNYVSWGQNIIAEGAKTPFKLSSTGDTITAEPYTGIDQKANTTWNAYLRVKTVADDDHDSATPAPVFVKIHFQKDGTAGITDTSKDGVLDTYTLAAGKSKKLNVKATAASGAAVAATFESENADIATVDANGVVKAVAAGTTRVKVTAGTVTGYYVINVKPNAVAGVKVANVKGAKVKVSWKAAKGSNVKYYVYKTVWNKKGVKVSKAGKTVSSTSTTLKVAKGYTVQVKVKAYVDTDETRLVGAYSATVAKTTDRK
ncbi:MAG: Ig-like domain-containing protein [Eubacterium sp.]|jgi:hypothetical protein|nr:Ig-like domain-containing protein [Eubacterium sp.]